MASPTVEFYYDISCPFAYIASTRIEALAKRTGARLIWRPVLLGAIYRATSAPQGAAGSASDVFNASKKNVTTQAMQRTLRRYQIEYSQPPQHPRKTVNALRLLYALSNEERAILTKKFYRAYWVEGRDVNDEAELMSIVQASNIKSISALKVESISTSETKAALEQATADVIARGSFGVPGFWIPDAHWTDRSGKQKKGRLFWGQDRMHLVEATLLASQVGNDWAQVHGMRGLIPRCRTENRISGKVKLEFWYDFSSPWSFVGWTQLERLKRTYSPNIEIIMKPFLLGILLREIGAPNLPMFAAPPVKTEWALQDLSDWVKYWNAVNDQEGRPDKRIEYYWTDNFPIRSPVLLRCAIADPSLTLTLFRACWEQNVNFNDEASLVKLLNQSGHNGPSLIQKSNSPEVKQELRDNTASARPLGLCGAPSYRVLRQTGSNDYKAVGGIVWGQDCIGEIEDLICGWDAESMSEYAEPRKGSVLESTKARL